MSELYRLPELPPGVRALSDAEFDRLRQFSSSLSLSPRDCPTCRGKGKFRWWVDEDDTEIGEYKCPCNEQWLLHTYLLNAGMGLALQRLRERDVRGVPDDASKEIQDYKDHLEGYIHAGVGLILLGEKGTGKSMTSALLLKHLVAEKGLSGYYTGFGEMLSALSGGWTDEDERKWFHRHIRNVGVLVIDDIGREHYQRFLIKGEGLQRIPAALAESAIDDVLRHRVASDLPTIVTTNLTHDEIATNYGDNIVSLLSESVRFVDFKGTSYRDIYSKVIKNEVKQGMSRPVVVE